MPFGVEFSCCGSHFDSGRPERLDIEPERFRLRRRKDADELAKLKHAIAATGAMYARAREIIKPGINELDVFNELQAVAVRPCGETLTGTGKLIMPAASLGARRAIARDRWRIVHSDLGRHFVATFHAIAGPLPSMADRRTSNLPPGGISRKCLRSSPAGLNRASVAGPCSKKSMLTCAWRCWGNSAITWATASACFRTRPHLNPTGTTCSKSVTSSPPNRGSHAAELRAGIRLENDYLVTERGVELLSDFPLEL